MFSLFCSCFAQFFVCGRRWERFGLLKVKPECTELISAGQTFFLQTHITKLQMLLAVGKFENNLASLPPSFSSWARKQDCGGDQLRAVLSSSWKPSCECQQHLAALQIFVRTLQFFGLFFHFSFRLVWVRHVNMICKIMVYWQFKVTFKSMICPVL